MDLENYSKRINSVRDIEAFGQLSGENQKQNSFNVKNNQMVLEEINKSRFAQINEKHYYFATELFPCPFTIPPSLILNVKKSQIIEKCILDEKQNLLAIEKKMRCWRILGSHYFETFCFKI